ncbi:hydrogenase maturation protease [candidate division WOR-3 bacterium]|nr:hydrogenase maturation protease [candidate division WOR-3 bacterium]
MRILLCGMGNKERGDDGFGPYIVENIQETDNIKKIDCNIYPENYLNKIIALHPDLIIFLDTIKKQDLRVILLKNKEILQGSPISISTHNLPFSAIYQYLKENTNAHIWFLGVKPYSYERLSDKTITIANRIIDFLNSLDGQKKLSIIKTYETLTTTLR